MNIITKSEIFSQREIETLERHYKAKYICESCLKTITKQWANYPAAFFYTEKPHPRGSNWFAIYYNTENKPMVTNGVVITEPFEGIQIDDDVIFSRYRHDYREHRGVFVDGGRDYLRCGGQRYDEARVVKLKAIDDHLEIVE